jgi:UDP-GlcNAc:undecaprenyl-phosphate GlcNAc-1-phosphate transferase
MEHILYLVVLVQAGLLSLILTPIAARVATRTGIIDHPSESRKIHRTPTPYLGGAAIFVSFYIVILADLYIFIHVRDLEIVRRFYPLASGFRPEIRTVAWRLAGLLTGGFLIFLVGLTDDIRKLSPWAKIAGQVLAAGVFCLFLSVAEGRPFRFLVGSAWVSIPAMIHWIVAVMNSFNLIDNMDGLSGGVAAIATFFFAGVCYLVEEQTFLILAYLALLGAILGFLYHNWNPAKIFMGDAGSLFLGYTIGALSILSQYLYSGNQHHLVLFVPAVILSLPMFDTLSVIAIRLKRGLRIWQADKNHFSHRLVDLGMTQKNAVLLIYLVTFCTGLVALLLLVLLQMAILFTIILLLERTGAAKKDNFAPLIIVLQILTIVVVLLSLARLAVR